MFVLSISHVTHFRANLFEEEQFVPNMRPCYPNKRNVNFIYLAAMFPARSAGSAGNSRYPRYPGYPWYSWNTFA